MSKLNKKEIRKKFREVCYKRDNYTCVKCGLKATSVEEADKIFDVHHIVSRKNLSHGGYCLQNGIVLCLECHLKAEQFYSTGIAYPGYSIDELYTAIGSSLQQAIEASEKLK